jgi:predicted nuclease of predicted toxin-antitoxin system
MKILLDTCVWGGLVEELRTAGHDVVCNLSSRQQASICLRAIELHRNELESGAIITAEQSRLRIRTVDKREEYDGLRTVVQSNNSK